MRKIAERSHRGLRITAFTMRVTYVMPALMPLLDCGCSLSAFPGTTQETEGSVPRSTARRKSSWWRMFSCCPVSSIVVKRGAKGASHHDLTGSTHLPGLKVEEIDPTGAGDCFGGTFVACLTLGVPLERALLLANAAGALAVGKKGPMEGNSTMTELEAFLAARREAS